MVAEKASADFAVDVKKSKNWIQFGNGRTASSNGGNGLGSIFLVCVFWFYYCLIVNAVVEDFVYLLASYGSCYAIYILASLVSNQLFARLAGKVKAG